MWSGCSFARLDTFEGIFTLFPPFYSSYGYSFFISPIIFFLLFFVLLKRQNKKKEEKSEYGSPARLDTFGVMGMRGLNVFTQRANLVPSMLFKNIITPNVSSLAWLPDHTLLPSCSFFVFSPKKEQEGNSVIWRAKKKRRRRQNRINREKWNEISLQMCQALPRLPQQLVI